MKPAYFKRQGGSNAYNVIHGGQAGQIYRWKCEDGIRRWRLDWLRTVWGGQDRISLGEYPTPKFAAEIFALHIEDVENHAGA